MKKFLILIFLIISSMVLGYLIAKQKVLVLKPAQSLWQEKRVLMRLALVADSENENELLEKALRQAAGEGINLVIGLGDWSQVGTVEELTAAKQVFEKSKLAYFVTAGDHDLWDSRNRGQEALANYKKVFGQPSRQVERNGIQIVILDNSDIYLGLSPESLELSKKVANSELKTQTSKLTFVMAHKTPFHPESKHVMGEDSSEVARQAQDLLAVLQRQKVDGFFSGDLHFFAKYQDPSGFVKMTTVGAVASERNFQGPRFAIVTVFDDYSWEVRDVEIR